MTSKRARDILSDTERGEISEDDHKKIKVEASSCEDSLSEEACNEDSNEISNDPLNSEETLTHTESSESDEHEETGIKDNEHYDSVCQAIDQNTVSIENAEKTEEESNTKADDQVKRVKTGFVFGTAAKSIISFAALGSTAKSETPFFAAGTQESESANTTPEGSIQAETTHVETGEEEEITVCSFKAKLFEMSVESKDWVEKGLGSVKINHCPESETGSYNRIIMRADGVPRVLINQRIYAEMKNELVNEKNLRLALISDGSVKHLLLRFRDSGDAHEFSGHLQDRIEDLKLE